MHRLLVNLPDNVFEDLRKEAFRRRTSMSVVILAALSTIATKEIKTNSEKEEGTFVKNYVNKMGVKDFDNSVSEIKKTTRKDSPIVKEVSNICKHGMMKGLCKHGCT